MIVSHHLGGKARRAEALTGGLTNHVFRVRTGSGSVIVRLGETGGKTEAFVKEQWAVARAAAAGVPVVRILEVGSDVIDTPYMILEEADGGPATAHSDPCAILRRLGEAAARLHAIGTQGFGDSFDWSANTLSTCATFGDYLGKLGWEARLDVLKRTGAVDRERHARLRALLEEVVADAKAPARLNHGDLRLKNLFVGKGGAIRAVIDWEDCISAPPLLWDLPIALHDLGPDGAEAFAQGYGLEPAQAIALRPRWAAMNALHYAPLAEGAAQAGEEAQLGWLRARLMGAFDLFTA